MPPALGIISDTHGLLRPEAVEKLQGVDHIIHAGDVGDPHILGQLRQLAPVTAVRGNVDGGGWADALPYTEILEWEGVSFYVIHILQDLALDPSVAGFQAVVSGHSHKPTERTENGVLYLNPGSIGPRRFHLPISMIRLQMGDTGLEPEFIELED